MPARDDVSSFVRGHVTRQTAPADVKRSHQKRRDVSTRPLSTVGELDDLKFIDDANDDDDEDNNINTKNRPNTKHATAPSADDDGKKPSDNDVINEARRKQLDLTNGEKQQSDGATSRQVSNFPLSWPKSLSNLVT